MQTLQAAAVQAPAQVSADIAAKAEAAAAEINIDEASTRALIDEQLRARGWEVDTQTIRYSAGTRPAKGRNLAIAEWPTKSGPADYALFVGTRASAWSRQSAGTRTSRPTSTRPSATRATSASTVAPRPSAIRGRMSAMSSFFVPFVFSANGRPYLKQIETESGIWFRDARKPSNHRRALADWPTPDGLKGMLEIDVDSATADLKAQPFDFGFPLRPYQRRAIETVEDELAHGRRTMLLAMATGTGKTKLAIAMLYRLLAAKRFRRICFVVDRNALGTQAAGEFSTTQIVSAKTFADIFGLKGLEDVTPDPETKVHICTIQGLVKRVLFAADSSETPPVDQYDLMVVDECHRGYLLDREMSDAELSFRSQDDYISKYRRVLEYFDAVKIGLTATPALHTVSIFGDPIFKYSYREAVIDGYLIDHEPPIRIKTALSQAGIKFKKGEQLELLNTRTGEIDLAHTPTKSTSRSMSSTRRSSRSRSTGSSPRSWPRHIDPTLPGKTLIFAVTDAHADIVVDAAEEGFRGRLRRDRGCRRQEDHRQRRPVRQA